MRFFAIDDEPLMLQMLIEAILEVVPDAELYSYTNPSVFIEEAERLSPDIAFLDIEMPTYTGLELSSMLKKINPRINLIFVTGYSQYSLDALKLFASGYILKPVDAEEVRNVLSNLRFLTPDTKNEIQVKTFGNFSLFIKGEPVKFRLSRSREILAYLVDREGAAISKSELAAAIFEDDYSRSVQADITRAVRWLVEDLQAVNAEKILHRDNGTYSVAVSEFSCDLYDWLAHKGNSAFSGEYMEQYSWAEYRKATFMRMCHFN